MKPAVMRAACRAGAELVNDVFALQAAGSLDAVRETGAAVCLMHMQGEPRTMQDAPHYDDVVAEVRDFLVRRVAICVAAGIERERLRSEEHTSELQSLMRISYAVFCLKKKHK